MADPWPLADPGPVRAPGPSVRVRLALSYAAFLAVTGTLLIAVVWVFLLRYVPEQAGRVAVPDDGTGFVPGLFVPGRSDLWRAFAPKAALALGFLLLLGIVGGWFLAGRMLAPMTRISEAVRLAGGGSLSHRVRLPGRHDELSDLADAFDAMLARLEAHVAEQRRFAANASHELRTPLAITQTLLDVARKEPDRPAGELVERLQAVNSRAIELTEALLLLSRADGRAFTAAPVDLSLAAEQAAETSLALAEARGVTIAVAGDPAHAVGSPALLLQMITNLVHNAVVHNLPRGGTVTVTTAARPGGPLLVVENTGPVLAPHLVTTLTEPFRRGTDRVHGDHAGAGLGLAIVSSIVRAHDGRLALTPRAAGGLRVEVRLRPAGGATGFPWPQDGGSAVRG